MFSKSPFLSTLVYFYREESGGIELKSEQWLTLHNRVTGHSAFFLYTFCVFSHCFILSQQKLKGRKPLKDF